MKKTTKALLCACVFMTIYFPNNMYASASTPVSGTRHSDPGFYVNFIKDVAGQKLTLLLTNHEHKRVFISISSKEGNLYRAMVQDSECIRRFDLSTLEDGQYTVEASCGKEKYTKSITIDTKVKESRVLEITD